MFLFRRKPQWKRKRAGRKWLRRFGQPDRDKPTVARERKPDAEFIRGGVVAQVFISRSRFGRYEYLLRVGRWQTNGRRFFLEELFFPEDVHELLEVIQLAAEFIREETNRRFRRR
jgi:hypothetical protein